MSLLVHAPNVHQGGGKALLLALLEAAKKRGPVKAILDERLELPEELAHHIFVSRVRASILGRLAGEWQLKDATSEETTVLCFGNLPPLFQIKGRTILFLQNRYLVTRHSLNGFPLAVQLRIKVERFWLIWRARMVERIIVQTPSMQRQAIEFIGHPAEVIAFFSYNSNRGERQAAKKKDGTITYDFLYVASGEPHKNHVRLLEAWKMLAEEGLFPSLCLTISDQHHGDLIERITQAKNEHGLRIENVSFTSPSDIDALYKRSRAVVYPSTLESFGLPLLEAKQAGLAIVAGELDYVRDIVEPAETFDPLSSMSIARAVKRFLGVKETRVPIVNAELFIEKVLYRKE